MIGTHDLTASELATRLNVSTPTILRGARTGAIPSINIARPGAKRPSYRFNYNEVVEARRPSRDPWARNRPTRERRAA